MEDAHREAREAIIEARQAVEDERENFEEMAELAKKQLLDFHKMAQDTVRALVSDCDRQLKDTVLQLQSFLLRGTLQSS